MSIRSVLLICVVVGIAAAAAGIGTYAAFSGTTSNTGNSFASGTVTIADNDSGSALLSLANAKPTDSSTGCIKVTYTGSLAAGVRLYANVTGSLAQYLTLTVTRGTNTSSFPSCAAFSADATDYGNGPGVVYTGNLSAVPRDLERRARRPDRRLGHERSARVQVRRHGAGQQRGAGAHVDRELHVGGEEQLSVAEFRAPVRLRAAWWSATRLAAYAVLDFAAVIAFVLVVPSFFGYGSPTVLSGSMEPTLHVGDVVIEQRIPPLSARIGDVVTFRDPEAPARPYTHRIVSMSVTGEEVSFVTQGDANTGVERWRIPVGGTIVRVEYRIPLAGFVTNRAGSRLGRLGLIVVPVILLAIFEVRRIWRR